MKIVLEEYNKNPYYDGVDEILGIKYSNEQLFHIHLEVRIPIFEVIQLNVGESK